MRTIQGMRRGLAHQERSPQPFLGEPRDLNKLLVAHPNTTSQILVDRLHTISLWRSLQFVVPVDTNNDGGRLIPAKLDGLVASALLLPSIAHAHAMPVAHFEGIEPGIPVFLTPNRAGCHARICARRRRHQHLASPRLLRNRGRYRDAASLLPYFILCVGDVLLLTL